MKKQFVFTFVLLLALGLGGSALAQGVDYSNSANGRSTASPEPSPTDTPTPNLTPSESPALVVAIEESSSNTIDPIWVFLAGALIGAALLSLAEVSGVSYVKKHGKGLKK